MKKKSDKEILGNDIETVRSIDNRSISPNYRGSISFNVESFDGNKDSILDSCPTRALSTVNARKQATIAVDHGKCMMCGYCSLAAPEFITIQSKPASPVKIKKQLSEYSNSLVKC